MATAQLASLCVAVFKTVLFVYALTMARRYLHSGHDAFFINSMLVVFLPAHASEAAACFSRCTSPTAFACTV